MDVLIGDHTHVFWDGYGVRGWIDHQHSGVPGIGDVESRRGIGYIVYQRLVVAVVDYKVLPLFGTYKVEYCGLSVTLEGRLWIAESEVIVRKVIDLVLDAFLGSEFEGEYRVGQRPV